MLEKKGCFNNEWRPGAEKFEGESPDAYLNVLLQGHCVQLFEMLGFCTGSSVDHSHVTEGISIPRNPDGAVVPCVSHMFFIFCF